MIKVDFSHYSRGELQEMLAAGYEIKECYRVLEKVSGNVVGEILRMSGTFYEWDHYPDGDVYDSETHSQYYYHAHRSEFEEHGHFHTFLRRKGIPRKIKPVDYDGETAWPTGNDVLSHIIGISMEKKGYPTHLFTTNRWVTGENWFRAEDVIEMSRMFLMDHSWPSWPTNRWITAVVKLFHPQIATLLLQRDARIAEWQAAHPDRDVFEDRDLEITSYSAISVETQMRLINQALEKAA